jgi:hypothetical protein
VLVTRFRALGYDAIAIVDNGCVDESKRSASIPQTQPRSFSTRTKIFTDTLNGGVARVINLGALRRSG